VGGTEAGGAERAAVERAQESGFFVGTSGYSFRDWVGTFYPEGTRGGQMLPLYARSFPAVEVNTTYYRMPGGKLFERMVERTPEGFAFMVKAYRGMTHERSEWERGAICAPFLEALEPLRAAGRLRGVLLQFPWSFRNVEENRRHLLEIREKLPEVPLFAEFRRDDWNREAVFRMLEQHGIGYCSVDEPDLPGLMPPVHRVTNGVAYVRLHGRNRDSWWGRSGKDRYDYLYTREELREWVRKIRSTLGKARSTFVFFNNCYAGQAADNARVMQELLFGGA
jgi:uncharacterized protein YecE (DUF72 family)